MKYILIGNNNTNNIKHTILQNRGITDVKKYLELNSNCLYDYSLLDNINEGVKCLTKHIENKSKIHIIVD